MRFFLILALTLSFQPKFIEAQSIPMHVLVKNLSNARGAVYIAVYNNEKDYMKNRFAEAVGEVSSPDELLVKIDVLPGTYAVTIFHDLNGDGELNTNFLGIPKEPYGFSNNPRIRFGPPNFKEASFEFKEKGQIVEIHLNN